MKNTFIVVLALILFARCSNHNSQGIIVEFPDVSDPVQITESGKEHLFASYYGINSWSKSQRFVTVLETALKYKIPGVTDTATLGLVDLQNHNKFIPIAKTTAWNFQQGCMAHWLGTSPDSLIIYNDMRDGKFSSVILNVHTKKEVKIFPYPVSAVSPDGKNAISINFSRLSITRKAYGYAGEGQDPKKNVQAPDDDGLFMIDLETGKSNLIISINQVKDIIHDFKKEDIIYFNHTLFSRKGNRIFWLTRTRPNYNTTSLTANIDGTNIQRCFPDDWSGSHFDWLNDNELMITANHNAKQWSHVLFTIGKKDYKRLGKGLLDYDGHGTFSPNGKWMITDTYPSSNREQKIYLMDMKSEAILPLGRFLEPAEYHGGWRCDIHCRWSPNGDMVGFNSTHTGSRQVYIMKFDY